ncbi:hypothetical protein M231_06767 [Tremella mesenterica]|uniref:Uncharacterized protein n=1 Tax=Tremella mesenterica TaxID=5217 RepID=A0A4Q1BDI9_TREME|nr:uncharacterized protein TREMEDRAFT_62626 [Tremella mesenterica DSM 1558]EIW68908.1 hypothetical protein TREMEDRAFT_62626 [Tremella mesenterica DSM 1558]RXK35944.1 hypothetical protein M231_06767 [Tremella mesenterica]
MPRVGTRLRLTGSPIRLGISPGKRRMTPSKFPVVGAPTSRTSGGRLGSCRQDKAPSKATVDLHRSENQNLLSQARSLHAESARWIEESGEGHNLRVTGLLTTVQEQLLAFINIEQAKEPAISAGASAEISQAETAHKGLERLKDLMRSVRESLSSWSGQSLESQRTALAMMSSAVMIPHP